jgi:tRNA(Ile)-lysidine synthase
MTAGVTTEEALHAVRRAVEASLADLLAQDIVLIAVSGGADSLALARGTAALRRSAVVGIIDHDLQQGSAAVASNAARECERMGIDNVLVERVTVGLKGSGPEAAAREARRVALEAMADRLGARAILLGHTRDDQAETVLLRLSRGSGARSLAAMAPAAGLWRRPLLDLPRQVVRASVADLAVWEDPHNADSAYARARVRHVALPALVEALGSDVVAGLARSARLLRDDADALDGIALEAAQAVTGADGALDARGLLELPRAVRTRVIKSAILAAGAPGSAVTSAHIDRIDALVSDWRGQGPVDLPGGLVGERRYGRLMVLRAPPVADRRRDNREE